MNCNFFNIFICIVFLFWVLGNVLLKLIVLVNLSLICFLSKFFMIDFGWKVFILLKDVGIILEILSLFIRFLWFVVLEGMLWCWVFILFILLIKII